MGINMRISRYKNRVLYFVICFIAAIFVSFIICNATVLENIAKNYSANKWSDFESYHWLDTKDGFVSMEDPQIIFHDINTYVNDLNLHLELDNALSGNVILYYQEPGDTEFTAVKSMSVPFNSKQKSQPIYVRRYVQSLRIDLTEHAGVNLNYDYIEINSRAVTISNTAIILGLLVFSFCIILFSFRNFIREIWDSRDILKTLILNDLKSRYAGSFLGMIWAFVQPVLTIAVFWYVFELGFKNPPVENIQYILWFIPAYIPWMYFSDVAVNAVACIREYSYLVKKMKFKVSILPIIKVCSSFLIHFCFIVFMIVVFLCYHRKPMFMQLQVLYYCFALCIFLIGLAWLISAISVFIKDFAQIINVVLQLGFFMIPIFWNPSAMGETVLMVLKFNPLYYIVQGYRESMIDGISFLAHPELTIYFWLVTLIVFVIGAKLFDKVHVHFADLL